MSCQTGIRSPSARPSICRAKSQHCGPRQTGITQLRSQRIQKQAAMKRTGLQWLAISVLLIAALNANADTRPQYGGTLHISMTTSASSLDPAEMPDSVGGRNLLALIFDTLVTVDATGQPQSALAESWQSLPGDRGLEFHLRRNVKFHDGSPLTAEITASSLRKANPAWSITASGDQVTIESAGSVPE